MERPAWRSGATVKTDAELQAILRAAKTPSAIKVIDKAIRAVERQLPFKSARARNAMLSYAADDMADAYLIGAEEAQGEFLARLQAIRRSLLAAP